MKDISIIISIISLFAGVASISVSIFIKNTKSLRSLIYYIGLLISLFLIQSAIELNAYAERVIDPDTYITGLAKALDILGTPLSSLCGILLTDALLAKEITKHKLIIVSIFAVSQFVTIIICSFDGSLIILKNIVRVSIVLVIFYEIAMIILNYRKIGDKDLKKAINIFVIITIVFLPLFVLEYLRPHILWLKDMTIIKLLALPAYFLVINICTILFAGSYFNTPAYMEDNKLTPYFKQKYSITDKESEVIDLVLEGLTYKQIAEKLYIANKTVDNHIQNIYKKVDVTSKIQLFNLVRAKES